MWKFIFYAIIIIIIIMFSSSQNLQSLFDKIPWANLSWDLLLAAVLIGGSLLYSVFLGKRRVMVILAAIYMTLAVLAYTPFIGKISDVLGSTSKIAVFIIGFVVLFFLLSRGALDRIFKSGGYMGSWAQGLLFAFLQLGLLLSIFLSFLPPAFHEHFSPLTQAVLLSDWGRFLWLVLPLLVMVLLTGERKRSE